MQTLYFLIARLLLGCTWVIAGIAKLKSRNSLHGAVAEFLHLPPMPANIIAETLPWMELCLGVLLLVGKWTMIAAGASIVLLAAFMLAIVVNLALGRTVACGCFGQSGDTKISWWSALRNVCLMVVAAFLFTARLDYLTLDRWLRGAPLLPANSPASEIVPLLFILAGCVLLWNLGASSWGVLSAIARANDGPALGTWERQLLRTRLFSSVLGLEPLTQPGNLPASLSLTSLRAEKAEGQAGEDEPRSKT